jgi:CBS-domain-containing membrane protein
MLIHGRLLISRRRHFKSISQTPPGVHRVRQARRRISLAARRSSRKGRDYQPRFSAIQILLSWFGSFVAIALLAYLSIYSKYPLIAAPMGATSVLLFGAPHSPMAQPRNVVVGNLIGAMISVSLVQTQGPQPWVMALAVSTTITITKLTRTVHPPSGAVALVGVLSNVSWDFLFAPVLAGSIVMVLWTCLFNRLACKTTYPEHWL